MNDNAKTGLEREINRKLDALKTAILVLDGWEEISRRIPEILKEAWREEEEVQREAR